VKPFPKSVAALLEGGARPGFIVAATHGLFLEGAREKLDHAAIRSVFVTDTISLKQRNWAKLRVIPIAPLIGGAIKRLVAGDSLRPPTRNASEPGGTEKTRSWKNATLC
jgi:ribose-phosphate pyrophosphokinase